jgi:RNA polymerase sigma factor (sigma-70 family)
MTDTQKLLADYAVHGSEAAFRELTARYLDLVYSTAVRLVGGDIHLAEDVAQTVFVDLARLAKTLSREVRLGGWLHRHTCFVAAKTLRGERRRQSRERRAVAMNSQPDHSQARLAQIAPILDDAINRLGPADRAAVVLRFYERLDFRSLGEVLGSNEAAAQKRVSRALEKLHSLLKHRGVAFSAAALGVALTGEAVTAAPAGLAAAISGTVLSGAATGTGTTLTLLKLMAVTKLQTAVVTAIVLASVVTPLMIQRQAQAGLRAQDETLRQQAAQLAQLTADNQRLNDLLARAKNSPLYADKPSPELLALRGEVGRLQRTVEELTAAKSTTAAPPPEDQLESMKRSYAIQVDRLKQWLEANPSEKIPELQSLTDSQWLNAVVNLETDNDFARAMRGLRANAELPVLGRLGQALRKYATDNNGQFPADIAQLTPYLKTPIDDAVLQRYEILPASSLVSDLQTGDPWLITQKAPVNPALDLRMAQGLTESRGADERITNRWTLLH